MTDLLIALTYLAQAAGLLVLWFVLIGLWAGWFE